MKENVKVLLARELLKRDLKTMTYDQDKIDLCKMVLSLRESLVEFHRSRVLTGFEVIPKGTPIMFDGVGAVSFDDESLAPLKELWLDIVSRTEYSPFIFPSPDPLGIVAEITYRGVKGKEAREGEVEHVFATGKVHVTLYGEDKYIGGVYEAPPLDAEDPDLADKIIQMLNKNKDQNTYEKYKKGEDPDEGSGGSHNGDDVRGEDDRDAGPA